MASSHPDALIFKEISTTSYDTINSQLDELERTLTSAKIRVVRSSRINKYRRIISDFNSIATGKKPLQAIDIGLLHQALYEMRELMIIVEEFTKSPEIPNWHSRFQRVVLGKEFPEDEDSTSSSRDIQFELFTAAIFRKSGYEIELDEPDIIVKTPTLTFGVAAKRPKTIRRLEKNIRKANKQIVNSNLDGIIALDISRLQNPSNFLAHIEEAKYTVDAARQFTDYFAEKNLNKIRSLVNPTYVIGIVICMSAICLVGPDYHQVGTTTGWTVTNFVDLSDSRFELLRTLVKKISKGLL